MKKRLLSILLAVSLLCALLPAGIGSVSATEIVDSGTCGEGLTWALDSDGLLTISGTGEMEQYDLTETYTPSPWAFNGDIKELYICEGVTSISPTAFQGCTGLTKVSVPDSLTHIGDDAFDDCTSLPDIVLGAGVASVGKNPFSFCSNLTNIEVSDRNSTFASADGILYTKAMTTLLVCPGGKTGIITVAHGTAAVSSYAFEGCGISGVVVPEGVTSIGDRAFSNCTSLTEVALPDTLTSIGRLAFFYCKNLLGISIPEGVTSIEEGTFMDCWALSYAELPDSLTNIEMQAFFNCPTLKSLALPDGLVSIGDFAFEYCSSLEHINIPDGITQIGRGTFVGCALKEIILPNSVSSIGQNAFSSCTELTTAILGDGLTGIDDTAFANCSGLTQVYFYGNAPALGNNVFQNWDHNNQTYGNIPGLTLYYIEGKEGWTSPEWNGYPTAVWEPHMHSYTSAVTEPTCTEQGYTTYTCECGDSYIDNYVDALGHKTELQNAKEATCMDAGYTGDEVCTVCGETTKSGEVIAALGHDFVDGICSRCGEDEPVVTPPVEFTDVPEGSWYTEAVEFAVENGLMNGVGNNEFAPEDSMTRAMLVTVLWRYAGSPMGYENTFSDLTQDWYIDAVAWAAANSIVNGVGGGKFDPDGSITREQMATILYRYCEKVGIDTSASADLGAFPDGDKISDWAKDAISWANAVGLITGSEENGTVYLLPQGNATRAQVATILMRFIENIAK